MRLDPMPSGAVGARLIEIGLRQDVAFLGFYSADLMDISLFLDSQWRTSGTAEWHAPNVVDLVDEFEPRIGQVLTASVIDRSLLTITLEDNTKVDIGNAPGGRYPQPWMVRLGRCLRAHTDEVQ